MSTASLTGPGPDAGADPTGAASPAARPADRALDPDAVPGGVRAAVEAVLMVVESPVTAGELAEALGLSTDRVQVVLADLAEEYRAGARGFELRRSAGGWRVVSRADLAPLVHRFTDDPVTTRLSRAALETLAVIAYSQPVTRARVSAVRGVGVDSVVRTLLARGLVEEAGREEGGGALYRTTTAFLERLGLDTLADLPPIAPHLPPDEEAGDLLAALDGTMGGVVGESS